MTERIAFLQRYGAYGDAVITTPLVRKLKQLGYYVLYETNKKGLEILKYNPHVDEVRERPDCPPPIDINQYMADFVDGKKPEIPPDELKKLEQFWADYHNENDRKVKELKPAIHCNLTESIEVKLCLHWRKPEYYLPKEERFKLCSKNYYEHTFKTAGIEYTEYDLRPEVFFSEQEMKDVKRKISFEHFNVLVCLIGSGENKFYPWIIDIIKEISKLPDVKIITVGDERCRCIEDALPESVMKLSGDISFRESMAFVKYCNLIVSPDTGLLHVSGCFNRDKIALLGHTNRENITKHFTHCVTFEAECECAPCFRLIYDYKKQCYIDKVTEAAACMGWGINPMIVTKTIKDIYSRWYFKKMI